MGEQQSEREQNRRAKLQFIEAYFRDLEQRSDFLLDLIKTDHRAEALLLCGCYIEGLGNNLYWPDERSAWNFIRVLREHGGEEVLGHIHVKQLRNGLADAKSKLVQRIGQKLNGVLTAAEGRLYTEQEILALVEPAITADELETLRRNLWRGTLAALAYRRIRSPLVHELSTRQGVSFDRTTFRGEPVPDLDLRILYPALRRILQAMRGLSLASERWYGHDFKNAAEPGENKPEGE